MNALNIQCFKLSDLDLAVKYTPNMYHPLSNIQHAMQVDYYQNSGNNYISMVGFLEIIAVFCTDRSYDRNIETTMHS